MAIFLDGFGAHLLNFAVVVLYGLGKVWSVTEGITMALEQAETDNTLILTVSQAVIRLCANITNG